MAQVESVENNLLMCISTIQSVNSHLLKIYNRCNQDTRNFQNIESGKLPIINPYIFQLRQKTLIFSMFFLLQEPEVVFSGANRQKTLYFHQVNVAFTTKSLNNLGAYVSKQLINNLRRQKTIILKCTVFCIRYLFSNKVAKSVGVVDLITAKKIAMLFKNVYASLFLENSYNRFTTSLVIN